MSKDQRERVDVINLKINVEAVRNAARNVESLDDLALEIETLNPKKITLDQDIYTLKSVPMNESKNKDKTFKKKFAPRQIGIKSITVNSLANTSKEGFITINGTLDVPKGGNRVVKLDECLFETYEQAREVAKVLTEIELEKVVAVRDEANDTIEALQKQINDDRF